MKNETLIALAALLGGLGVILGAFGAHALTKMVDAKDLGIWETAVRYQMYHVFALIVIAIVSQLWGSSPWLVRAAWLMLIGMVLFSGSLYALVLTQIRILGAITPVGGVAMIAGWIALAVRMLQLRG